MFRSPLGAFRLNPLGDCNFLWAWGKMAAFATLTDSGPVSPFTVQIHFLMRSDIPMRLFLVMLALLLPGWTTVACAQQNPDGRLNLAQFDDPLIFLLRDAHVLKDIGATDSQQQQLLALANELDAIMWPSRNRSAEAVQQSWKQANELAHSRSAQILESSQQQRIREIYHWVYGTRVLLRPEVATELELTQTQQTSLQEMLTKSAEKMQKVWENDGTERSQAERTRAARKVLEDEQKSALRILNEHQQQEWARLAGSRIDVSKLGRVTFEAPELIAGPNDWLSERPAPEHDDRKLTAVHFFANGCINCIRNYEHYKGWDETFRDRGLVIVGIHTPETGEEYDVTRLRQKVAEAGFKFPILVDNEKKNWNAWGNSMWPSVYLIDNHGRIRAWWYGELNWQGTPGEQMMRQRIDELLSEAEKRQASR